MFLLFFAIWIILNGRVTVEILIFGLLVSAAMMLFICKFMDYSLKKELWLFKNIFHLLGYALVLIVEILKANFCVMRLTFSSRYEIEPVMVTFESPLKSKFLNVILANSITLTPGTITASMEDGKFSVHCLDKELAEGLDDSVFVHLLLKLDREAGADKVKEKNKKEGAKKHE